jgi:hypothetical protein
MEGSRESSSAAVSDSEQVARWGGATFKVLAEVPDQIAVMTERRQNIDEAKQLEFRLLVVERPLKERRGPPVGLEELLPLAVDAIKQLPPDRLNARLTGLA